MSTVETAGTCTAILDELERAVVGRRRTLELVLIGILAGGHVLRLTLRPELWVRQVSSDDVMAKLLSSVPTPRTDPARAQATAVTG